MLRTRHGIRLVPHDATAHLADYDYITFAAAIPPGVNAYDGALAEIATTHGKATARAVSHTMNDPAQGLEGGAPLGLELVPRIALLGLLGLLVAAVLRALIARAVDATVRRACAA